MTESEAIKMLEIQKPAYGCKEYQKPLMHAYEIAIKALEEIQQYRAIGTAEECRAAVGKQKSFKIKKLIWGVGRCKCGAEFLNADTNYCGNCGQKLDWRDEE